MEQELLNYYKEGNWEAVLAMLTSKQDIQFYNQLYLWIQPSQDDLQFIGEYMYKKGLTFLASVGCGTGLLEWLIHCVTGLKVIGIEYDKEWWESRYSPPTFLPLIYADEITTESFPPTSAIMFCYFNDKEAFHTYMEYFQGKCLIVIGPDTGSGKHTDPQPFDPKLPPLGWKLVSSREIQNTKDHIAIYERCTS